MTASTDIQPFMHGNAITSLVEVWGHTQGAFRAGVRDSQ